MKPKENLQLRKIGSQFLIVEACAERANMSNVYTLNETAAALWQQLARGVDDAERLAAYLCEAYEVDPATARADVERQLARWQACGLLD